MVSAVLGKHGGFGEAVETMLMMEEFGKGLVEPYLATVVACGSALNRFGSEDHVILHSRDYRRFKIVGLSLCRTSGSI